MQGGQFGPQREDRDALGLGQVLDDLGGTALRELQFILNNCKRRRHVFDAARAQLSNGLL